MAQDSEDFGTDPEAEPKINKVTHNGEERDPRVLLGSVKIRGPVSPKRAGYSQFFVRIALKCGRGWLVAYILCIKLNWILSSQNRRREM